MSSNVLGTFPFGQPVKALTQIDRTPKEIFVLGVYASAVHARWLDSGGVELVKALAVASEPYIFWKGEGAKAIIERIRIPRLAGRLEPAANKLNGPSGVALDELFLGPLGRARSHAWLADLVPHSCVNPQQQAAIDRSYRPHIVDWGLPQPTVPTRPSVLADRVRQDEIAAELIESKARVVVLLGDEPIRWFSHRWYPRCRRLEDFGTDGDTYGRLTEANIEGARVALLPLVHPRQAAKLGRSSLRWYELHRQWVDNRAPTLLRPPPGHSR
jgi:hypothetical protein